MPIHGFIDGSSSQFPSVDSIVLTKSCFSITPVLYWTYSLFAQWSGCIGSTSRREQETVELSLQPIDQ